LLAPAVTGCLRPPSPAEQVTEAARELNLAARFGRLDVAAERTVDAARPTFMQRRREWGNELRVVEIELSGLELTDKEHAQVLVNVSWMRMSEGLLHTTVLSQQWADRNQGWQLIREQRVSGDVGLFGEAVAPPAEANHPDVQFPSRTITGPAE
jgi:hypothetical protein